LLRAFAAETSAEKARAEGSGRRRSDSAHPARLTLPSHRGMKSGSKLAPQSGQGRKEQEGQVADFLGLIIPGVRGALRDCALLKSCLPPIRPSGRTLAAPGRPQPPENPPPLSCSPCCCRSSGTDRTHRCARSCGHDEPAATAGKPAPRSAAAHAVAAVQALVARTVAHGRVAAAVAGRSIAHHLGQVP